MSTDLALDVSAGHELQVPDLRGMRSSDRGHLDRRLRVKAGGVRMAKQIVRRGGEQF